MAAPTPIPDWLLERYALGELPAEKAGEIARRLDAEPELAARLQALKDSDEEALARYPAPQMAERIRRRAATSRRPAWQMPALFAAPALAAAVALLLLVRAPTPEVSGLSPNPPYADRVKGLSPHLVAYRVRDGRGEPVGEDDRLRPGDVVQLHYVAAGQPFGAVVSVDGAGAATLHWPERPSGPARLEPKGETSLPHAFELDDAPGFERFFFVTASEPVAAARVMEAARALAARPDAESASLDLPETWQQSSLCLRKDTP